MKRRLWLALSTVTLVGLGGATWMAATGETRSLPAGILAASGRLEGRTIRISSEVGGRVARLAVERGAEVVQGDLVAELDRRSLQASVDGIEARVAAAVAGAVAAQARVAALEAQAQLAETEAARYQRLFERDAVPRQVLDEAIARRASTDSDLEAARAATDLARRQVDATRAELRLARVQLDEAVIRAPVSGRVTSIVTRAGEMVGAGMPVLAVLSADPLTLHVYLPVDSAGRVRPGDEAHVYAAGYPNVAFPGTVVRVASQAEFTPKDVHMPDERATLVFAVDVEVPNPDGRLKDGFPADVWLRADAAVPWPGRAPW